DRRAATRDAAGRPGAHPGRPAGAEGDHRGAGPCRTSARTVASGAALREQRLMETLVSKSAVPSEVFVARLARALDRRRHETQLAPGAESPLPSALLAPLPFAEPAP